MAKLTISVMVIMDSSVDIATIPADISASPPYLVANMVDIAAIGADAEITQDTISTPRIPKRYRAPNMRAGIRISLVPKAANSPFERNTFLKFRFPM